LKYRPEIDGLRAVAILPVVLFHMGLLSIPGGFLGVDVFFVISGYLITTLIINDLDSNQFTFKGFWLRRIRRITPALFTMCIVTLLIALQLSFRSSIPCFGKDSIAAALSFANLHFMLNVGNYWGSAAESSPFLHTWSLSVEEQFYLFFPVIMFILWKMKISRLKFLIVSVAFSACLFVVLFKLKPTFCFYMLSTRGWELGTGALAAVILQKFKDHGFLKEQRWTGLMGLSLILIAYFIAKGNSGIRFIPLVAIGTFLVILNTNLKSGINKALSFSPFVFIGKISYSLYLWHWPAIVLARDYYSLYPRHIIIGIVIAVTFTTAILSYFLIEKPTRHNKYTPYLSAVLLIILLSLGFILKNYNFPKYDVSSYQQVNYYGFCYDLRPDLSKQPSSLKAIRAGTFTPSRDSMYCGAFRTTGIPAGVNGAKTRILVLGDSHAAMWGKTIDDIAIEKNYDVVFMTAFANSPFFDIPVKKVLCKPYGFNCDEFYEFQKNIIDKIVNWNPDLIILSWRWDYYQKSTTLCTFEKLIHFTDSLKINTLLIEQPPLLPFGDNNSAQYLSYLKVTPQKQYIYPINNSFFESFGSAIDSISKKIPTLSVFKLRTKLLNNGRCKVLDGNQILYFDDDHISYQCTNKFKFELSTEISRIIEDRRKLKW
jgi:peptidoglycan/LPS O-acetylase OafA/YrhL